MMSFFCFIEKLPTNSIVNVLMGMLRYDLLRENNKSLQINLQ
jgi:hypothetical protein